MLLSSLADSFSPIFLNFLKENIDNNMIDLGFVI